MRLLLTKENIDREKIDELLELFDVDICVETYELGYWLCYGQPCKVKATHGTIYLKILTDSGVLRIRCFDD